MAGTDPAATTATILAGVGKTGMRAVVGTGWDGLTTQPAVDMFVVDNAPFDLLFPRVAAVVHHGGAGTVAAGRPQVVCPFVADQPFWGRRMHDLGVAPEPIGQRRLTANRLAESIERTAVRDRRLRMTTFRDPVVSGTNPRGRQATSPTPRERRPARKKDHLAALVFLAPWLLGMVVITNGCDHGDIFPAGHPASDDPSPPGILLLLNSRRLERTGRSGWLSNTLLVASLALFATSPTTR